MRSNEARMSPLVVSGSIRGSLATVLSFAFSLLVVTAICRNQRHFVPRDKQRDINARDIAACKQVAKDAGIEVK